MQCVRALFLNAGFIASNWAWLHEPMLGHWGVGLGRDDRQACPRFNVTFEPCQVAVGRGRRSKVRPCSL